MSKHITIPLSDGKKISLDTKPISDYFTRKRGSKAADCAAASTYAIAALFTELAKKDHVLAIDFAQLAHLIFTHSTVIR